MARWFGLRTRSAEDTALDAWGDAIAKVLEPVDKEVPGLGGQLLDYVTTGAPLAALTALQRGATWHVSASLFQIYGHSNGTARAVLERLPEVPPDAAVRWGKVLEAASGGGFGSRALPPVAGGHWAEALLTQIAHAWRDQRGRQGSVPLDVAVLAAALVTERASLGDLLTAAFRPGARSTALGLDPARGALRRMQGYDDAVAAHAEVIRPVVTAGGAKVRLVAIEMLEPATAPTLARFTPEVATLATSSSSQVRGATRPWVERLGAALVEPLKVIAVEGKPDERLHAVTLLRAHAPDDETTAWTVETALADRAPAVRALAESWLAVPEPDHAPQPELIPPPRPVIDWRVEVTPQLHSQLEALWVECNAAIAKNNEANAAHAKAYLEQTGMKAHWIKADRPLDPGILKRLVAALEAGQPPRPTDRQLPWAAQEPLLRWLRGAPLPATGVLILLTHLDLLRAGGSGLWWPAVDMLEANHERTGHPTLLELATMLDEMGHDGGAVVLRQHGNSYKQLGRHWPAADVVPFVTTCLPQVLALLRATNRDWSIDPQTPYRALATLPVLPRGVVDELFAVALAGPKVDRRPAQDALESVPGRAARVAVALSDGKGDVRTEAARWLARLADASTVTPLEAAVARERQDVAKAAMLDALEALGRPVERYLDRGALEVQAAATVAKGLPRDLAWLPWDAMPAVRWSDSGEPVARETLQWLVTQAVKAKVPEPNAILRRHCAMFEPRGREAFGQWLLEAWLAADVAPIDAAEAHARALQEATYHHQAIQQYPQAYADDPYRDATLEQITAAYLPRHSRTPAGSVVSSKGLLAVVAACAGERAAGVVEAYLREWYGSRAAQGKALIAMLAWIDHPSATQLVLSVGSRFRTKSFQDEANRQAAALAERKGWSVTELTDRTIPTARLEADGVLPLPYGERVFTAVLLPDLTLEPRSPEGQPIKALPAPRQTDDAHAAAEAKKTLAAARKELKSLVTLQTARLYEAMCTQRAWTVTDWSTYLQAHPVVGRLAQRLVWAARSGDGPEDVALFRPLEDGSLTDVDDEPVTLPDDARLTLAHATTVEPDVAAAWAAHLVDYEVTPLFDQMGRSAYRVPVEQVTATEITDVRGHLIETFTLRGKALKLGWLRGSTEDGAWFMTYDKGFRELGLVAQIEFTGTWLPEENRTVALRGLSVLRTAPEGVPTSAPGTPVPLGEVPPVLLAEVYNDVRTLAAAGPGYHPDWEKIANA